MFKYLTCAIHSLYERTAKGRSVEGLHVVHALFGVFISSEGPEYEG